MSVDALTKMTLELLETIDLCLKHRFYQSALILIYSGIDTMAWLSLPESELDVNKTYFEKWVNDFLLPNSELLCTATELYGARCGLIHSHTTESRLYRESEGEVKKIYYVHKNEIVESLQKTLEEKGESDVVPVKIEVLQASFISAILDFGTYLDNHPEEGEIALGRTGKFLVIMDTLGKK